MFGDAVANKCSANGPEYDLESDCWEVRHSTRQPPPVTQHPTTTLPICSALVLASTALQCVPLKHLPRARLILRLPINPR